MPGIHITTQDDLPGPDGDEPYVLFVNQTEYGNACFLRTNVLSARPDLKKYTALRFKQEVKRHADAIGLGRTWCWCSMSLAKLKKGEARRDPLSEDLALTMGLLFKLLAPMRTWLGSKTALAALMPWPERRRPTGWEWRCTAETPGWCWQRCGCC